MSPDPDRATVRSLTTLNCPSGHPIGISDGRTLWPFGARITATATLLCDTPDCHQHRSWHPPPKRTRRRS